MWAGVIAVALALAGCSSGPDEATKKACGLLLSAENAKNQAVWDWTSSGKPEGGSDAARAADAAFPSFITDAADAAPAALAPKFSELKRLTLLYAATGTNDVGVARNLTVIDVNRACESAGVDMPVVNMQTGVIE